MKRRTIGFLAIGIILAFACGLWAGSTILVGTLTAVNNTTSTSPGVVVGAVNSAPGTLTIIDSGMPFGSYTNAIVVNLQWSLDSNNWVTVASWSPPVTNAGSWTWSPSINGATNFERVSITTTNSESIGVIIQQ